MDRDRIRKVLESTGYKDWCDSCGRENILTRYECKGGECQDKVDHEDHCHEKGTEMCIPKDFPLVEHWIDCSCCIKKHTACMDAYNDRCDCHQECACQNP